MHDNQIKKAANSLFLSASQNGYKNIFSYDTIITKLEFPCEFLRVVQTQTILFLKSMSETNGSDLQRL